MRCATVVFRWRARAVLAAEQTGIFYQAPVWSADGSQLYYLHSESRPEVRVGRIERLTLATGARETVVDEVGAFDLSPDGRFLVLARGAGDAMSLQLIELANGARQELVAAGAFSTLGAPRFDPSSTRVLFAAPKMSGARVDSPTGPLAWLAPRAALAHGDPQDLWSVPVAGGSVAPALTVQGDEPAAAWSPDATRLAVLFPDALVIAPSAGGSPIRILVPGSHGTVDWTR
jgi:Tol biopolymer transport system component